MSDLKAQFEAAAAQSKQLATKPDNETMLALYAYYKQATLGDATGSRPGMFDMVGRAKYDAWADQKGASTEIAMQAYIDLVNKLKG
ncbi:MAG: acyl-CoA-binding protein [Caldilineaceae bacterium]